MASRWPRRCFPRRPARSLSSTAPRSRQRSPRDACPRWRSGFPPRHCSTPRAAPSRPGGMAASCARRSARAADAVIPYRGGGSADGDDCPVAARGGDSEPDDGGQREAGHRGPLHRSRCGQPLAHEPHRAAGAGPVPVGAADAVGVVVRVVHADLQQQRDSCRARGESPGRLTAHHRPGAGRDDRSQSQRQRPRPCAGDPVAGGGHR